MWMMYGVDMQCGYTVSIYSVEIELMYIVCTHNNANVVWISSGYWI